MTSPLPAPRRQAREARPESTMNVLDLFSGASGGWSLGLSRAGYRTVAACEIDDWRRAVFAAAHPGCRMYADVRELTAERLRADLGYLPDAVVGSPPCQEISAANPQGEGITDDHLFWEFARLVFEIRPVWAAAENSPRARTQGIDGIFDAFRSARYARWPCVVGADNGGANHQRKRMWALFADTERHELWQQPGWGERPNGQDAAMAGDDAQHPAREPGLRLGGILRRPGDQSAQAESTDADRARHALGSRLGSDDGAELPAALRDIGIAWPHWNGGIAGLSAACAAAGFGAVDDGSSAILAPGLRNRAIAALGDAVIPTIPEAIGRAMMSMFA